MPPIIFSLTQEQAKVLVAVADREPIYSARVETSLRRKGCFRVDRHGYHTTELTARGRAAANLARTLINDG